MKCNEDIREELGITYRRSNKIKRLENLQTES
jgi:hypothetical protein